MATLPTPDQAAREILSIFVAHFQLRPGKVLQINNFHTVWQSRGLQSEDFKLGMEFAAENGWVEVIGDGSSFRLTDAGFAKA